MTQQRQAPNVRATWIKLVSIIIIALICLFIVSIIPINGNPPILCSINNNMPVIGNVVCPKETQLPIDETTTPNANNADATATSRPQPTTIPPTVPVNGADCVSLPFEDDFESGLSSCWETINVEVVAIGDNTVIQLDGTNTTAVAEVPDFRGENFCVQFLVRQVSDGEHNFSSLLFNFRITDSGEYGMLFHFGENYIDFGKTVASEWEDIIPSADATFERDNEWTEVLVHAAGVYYFVKVNGQDVISTSDSSSITNGYLRWSIPLNGGIVQIDDVRVTDACS